MPVTHFEPTKLQKKNKKIKKIKKMFSILNLVFLYLNEVRNRLKEELQNYNYWMRTILKMYFSSFCR